MSQSNFLPDTIWRCKVLLNGKQRVSTIRNGQRKPYDLTTLNASGPHDLNSIFHYKGVWHVMHQASDGF